MQLDYDLIPGGVVSLSSRKAIVRCPFHDDRIPSAALFPSGVYYCSACNLSVRVPDKIVGEVFGITTHSIEPPSPKYPNDNDRINAVQRWQRIKRGTGYQALIRRFADLKHLPPDALQKACRPCRAGLAFPLWAGRGGSFQPTANPDLPGPPFGLYLVGVLYRHGGVIPNPNRKVTTTGFRGVIIPPKEYRPSWAWGGKNASQEQIVVMTEGAQHMLKVAIANPGVLALGMAGTPPSYWQREFISSLRCDKVVRILDPDRLGKEEQAVFQDLDLLTVEETKGLLKGLGIG